MKLKKTGNLLVQMLMFAIGSTASKKLLWRSILAIGLLPGLAMSAQAQITRGGDLTSVAPAANNTFDITGGTRKDKDTNLFHSFGQFGLKTGQTANFKPDAGITNILGRVVGGDPSVINGLIKVTPAIPATPVNLYLMNPAGIVFGQGASLDVNGAFTATTANAIGFGKDKWFHAFGDNKDVLTGQLTGNPTGFAFNTNNPRSIFNGSDNLTTNLDTQPGKSITLVGGTVISTGTIKTQGGNITITTVPDGKSVRVTTEGEVLALDLPIGSQTNSPPASLKPNTLPELLTGRGIDLAANGVKVVNEGGKDVVRLVSDNQLITRGDIITKDLNTSRSQDDGGAVSLNAQASIKTGNINSQSGNSDKKLLPRGGDVNLSTKTGNIIVNSIDTSSTNNSGGGFGGNLTITSAGLFRAIGLIPSPPFPNISIFTGGNETDPSPKGTKRPPEQTIEDQKRLGKIKITHGGIRFVTGAKVVVDEDRKKAGDFTNFSELLTITPIDGFEFKDGESGAVGAITSFNTNGRFGLVFAAQDFDNSVNPSKDEQIAKQKSADSCDRSSNSDPANSTAGNANTSTDPCQPNSTNSSGILQILNSKN